MERLSTRGNLDDKVRNIHSFIVACNFRFLWFWLSHYGCWGGGGKNGWITSKQETLPFVSEYHFQREQCCTKGTGSQGFEHMDSVITSTRTPHPECLCWRQFCWEESERVFSSNAKRRGNLQLVSFIVVRDLHCLAVASKCSARILTTSLQLKEMSIFSPRPEIRWR